MFLKATLKNNPELINAATRLHQNGLIEPNTYCIDLDMVRKNTGIIADTARKYGISLYFMTKQFGRNPLVAEAIVESGIDKAVAVDLDEARVLYKKGIKIGHLGHLVQIPKGAAAEALDMAPEVITCFGVEKAVEINEAARERKKIQPILLRVVEDHDFIYPCQEGGVKLQNLEITAEKIRKLTHVELTGVTSFPCFLFNEESGRIEATNNAVTVKKAADLLKDMGFNIRQINGPSATCASSIPILKAMGITHGEPGHALTGTTPLHAGEGEPEGQAMVYVTEVTHVFEDRAYVIGGGFYPRSRMQKAYIPSKHLLLDVDDIPPEAIDYYVPVKIGKNEVEVGDTVIFSFRTQIFVTRAKVALIDGVEKGAPELLGIFNSMGDELTK